MQATPAAVAAAPTWNVCHVLLELPGEKRVPKLKASPPEARCPKESGRSAGSPSPSLAPGVRAGTPRVVLFREQAARERVFFPTRDRKFQP